MALPEQAIDPRVLTLIHMKSAPTGWIPSVAECGCELRETQRGDRWFLCRYHDGMNDGLAMAEHPGDDS